MFILSNFENTGGNNQEVGILGIYRKPLQLDMTAFEGKNIIVSDHLEVGWESPGHDLRVTWRVTWGLPGGYLVFHASVYAPSLPHLLK